MHLRFVFIAVCAAMYGCATPEQQTTATPAATVPVTAPKPHERYVTGSRIPVHEEDTGAASVSASSKEAVQDDLLQRMNTGTSGK